MQQLQRTNGACAGHTHSNVGRSAMGPYRASLPCRQKRLKCGRRVIRTERVPFADPKTRVTRGLRQQIGLDCQSMPCSRAAVRHGVNWSTRRVCLPLAGCCKVFLEAKNEDFRHYKCLILRLALGQKSRLQASENTFSATCLGVGCRAAQAAIRQ